MNALLYLRVGRSPSQKGFEKHEKQTIEKQEQILTDLCKEKGYDIAGKIIRQGPANLSMDNMMGRIKNEVKDKNIDVIVVSNISRLSRHTEELLELYEWFGENGVRLEMADMDNADLKEGISIINALKDVGNVDVEEPKSEGISMNFNSG